MICIVSTYAVYAPVSGCHAFSYYIIAIVQITLLIIITVELP